MRATFGDFELDSERLELRRGGSAIEVQPLVLEVITYLIANRDRVVSKDELVAEVWQGRFVGDDAVSRSIYEARRALGDDSRQPRFIATVARRGYRFVAEPRPAGEAAASERQDGGPRRAASDDRRIRGAASLAVVAAATAAGFWLLRPAGQRLADSGPGPPGLALLPLSVAADDPAHQLHAVAVVDLLTASLAAVPGLLLRPPEYSGAASARSSSLADFALASRSSHVLSGSLGRGSGPGTVRLEMILYRLSDGGALDGVRIGAFDLPTLDHKQDLERYLAVRQRIAETLLAEVLPAMEVAPVLDGAPMSAEGYRLYLTAKDLVRQRSCTSALGAIEILRRSVGREPGFARAWSAYGTAQLSAAILCGRGSELIAAGLESLDRGLELAPGDPQLISRKAAGLLESGRVEEAYIAVAAALELRPSDLDLVWSRSIVLRYAGYLEEARRSIDLLLAADPIYYQVHHGKPNTFLYLRQWQRYLENLPGIDNPHFRFYRGLAHLLAGDRERALAEIEPAFRLDPNDTFARFCVALAAILDGESARAKTILESLALERQSLGLRDGEMTYKIAQLLHLAGDREGALDRLGLAVAHGFFCSRCIALDPLFEDLVADPEFTRIVASAERRHREFGRRFGLSPEARFPDLPSSR